MWERRLEYKTKGMKGLMFKGSKKVRRKAMTETERMLYNAIVELVNRVESLEKEFRVLKRTVYSRR